MGLKLAWAQRKSHLREGKSREFAEGKIVGPQKKIAMGPAEGGNPWSPENHVGPQSVKWAPKEIAMNCQEIRGPREIAVGPAVVGCPEIAWAENVGAAGNHLGPGGKTRWARNCEPEIAWDPRGKSREFAWAQGKSLENVWAP